MLLRLLKTLLYPVALLTAFTYCLTVLAAQLPELGSPTANAVSQTQKRLLKAKLETLIHNKVDLFNDRLVYDYIHDMVQRLLPYTDLQGQQVTLYVADNDSINALAGPGGIIVINSGTVKAAKNPSQLASILAHELSHLSHDHILQGLAHQNRLQWATLAGLLAAIAAGAAGQSDVSQGAIAGTMAASQESLISFTRQQERQADNASLELMYKAGYDPHQMPAFFERMAKLRHIDNRVPGFLRTHPLTSSRIGSTRQLADQYPESDYAPDLRFLLVQKRIDVLTSNKTNGLADDLGHRLKDELTLNQQSLHYGYALALAKQGDYRKAWPIAQQLYQKSPHEPFYVLLKARLLIGMASYDRAIGLLQQECALFPDNMALLLRKLKYQTYYGSASNAIKQLQRALNDHPDNPAIWYMLAKAQHKAGHDQRSKLALAESYARQQQWQRAVLQLEQLLNGSTISNERKKIIQARLQRYQNRHDQMRAMEGG